MELGNISTFVSDNQESIETVSQKVSNFIESLDINTQGQISIGKLLKINGEIGKIQKNSKEFKIYYITAFTVNQKNYFKISCNFNKKNIKQHIKTFLSKILIRELKLKGINFNLIFLVPSFIKTLQISSISSRLKISFLGRNCISSAIQYVHLKSHLSVTDTLK